MQTLHVNGYDMAYLEIGRGPPMVLVHGTLGDFRTWSAVFGPLSKEHRVISVSLRHFFPEHWNGADDDYRMAQHVTDVIGFIEKLGAGPVDLVGHSRGGHIGFRVAQARPDLLRRLVLAEPGGELEGAATAGPSQRNRIAAAAEKVAAGDVDGGLKSFFEGIEGEGTWAHLPAAAKQQLRDNATTLIGQVDENRQPYRNGEAEAVRTPTLFIGGADTKGSLATIYPALAARVPGAKTAMIPGAGHWMFDQAPQRFCEAVLEFLAA